MELAEWERGHEKLFAEMRASLTDEERVMTASDPDGEAELYIRAMADGHVFNVRKKPEAVLRGKKKPKQVIEAALVFERDSILFFLGMKAMVPARLGSEKVDRVIAEEKRHVAYLMRKIGELDKKEK
jgi:rubrerythrin